MEQELTVIEVFTPTCCLRLYPASYYVGTAYTLQQLWQGSLGTQEWRGIPKVKEEELNKTEKE